MFSSGHRSLQVFFCLVACLCMAAGSGCGTKSPWYHAETGPLLESVKVSDLHPGDYCEIEMVVPPLSPQGSFHCFKGTFRVIDHDEIVLDDVLEGSCIDYGPTAHQPKLTQQKRDLVRVPLTGIEEIWALPSAKEEAAAKSLPKPSAAQLPSSGARPQPVRASSVTEAPGSPPTTSRISPSPLSETPAHFDASPAAGDAPR